MDWSDLGKLQGDKQPGTPEGNMSRLTAFGQKTKKQKTSESVEYAQQCYYYFRLICEKIKSVSVRLSVCPSVCSY